MFNQNNNFVCKDRKLVTSLFILFGAAFIVVIFIVLFSIGIKADSIDLVDYPVNTPSLACTPTQQSSVIEPLAPSQPAKEIVIELNNDPLFFPSVEYKYFLNITDVSGYISELENSLNTLSKAIASNEYSSIAVGAMTEEYVRIQSIYTKVQSDMEKYAGWETGHYYATKTFLFLKRQGYPDAVACGIIGNMMIETSGGSLNLNPTIYHPNGSYYGLCQWSLKYYPQIKDASFEAQLEFLQATIAYEFNTFGKLYKKGFMYEDFLTITDPAEAAYIFARVYERCNSTSYNLRRQAAEKAYEYFVLGN
jgi:hypothetical protein